MLEMVSRASDTCGKHCEHLTDASTMLSTCRCITAAAAGDYDAEGIITPEAYLRHAQRWVAAGANIIGGCCGVGPQHVQLLASSLQAAE